MGLSREFVIGEELLALAQVRRRLLLPHGACESWHRGASQPGFVPAQPGRDLTAPAESTIATPRQILFASH
jgi:hypothetical protein